MTEPNFHDVELLSALLDGELSQADSARLQARLAASPELRALLHDLSQSRALLRSLPQRRAPRNFTLSRQQAGLRPPLPRAYPILRYASGLAFALFLFSFLANFLSLPAAQQTLSAAQAPADTARVGLAPPAAAATPAPTQSGPFLGGGAPEATGTVLPQLGAALAPTETPAGTPGLGMIAPAPTQAPAANATVTKSAAPPRFPGWEAGMLALALLLALGAFVIRWRTERDFARKAGKG